MIEHLARITWSDQYVRLGLPTFGETIDPAWVEDGKHVAPEGWSLVCKFDVPPSIQGSPSQARVRFYVSEAPHDILRPGARLRLFERGTTECAQVEILE